MSYNLERFIKAQELDYKIALSEIRQGRKRSHWIWYIFPQLRGLGYSSMADYYGIENLEEAKAYLGDATLKARLIEISEALLSLPSNNASEIMGHPDDIKLFSSMTLFAEATGNVSVFQDVLDKFYEGKRDMTTIKLLNGD